MSSEFIPKVFLSGGLGNQLFQLAAGLQLSSKFMVLNTSQLGESFELESFIRFLEKKRDINIVVETTKPTITFQKAHNYLLRSKTWKSKYRVLNALMKISIKVSFFLSGVKPQNVFIEGSEFDNRTSSLQKRRQLIVIGYFQQESIASEIRRDLIEFLEMTFEMLPPKDMSQFSSQLLVHIRKGDYVTEEGIGMLSMSYFLQALADFQNMNEISTINLFTNGKIDPFELQNIFEFGNLIESDSDSAIKLLAMMRQCENFLISNSTLSWWAAYLSTNSRKQVVAPTPWFRKLPEPINLIPKDWIRSPAIWDLGNES